MARKQVGDPLLLAEKLVELGDKIAAARKVPRQKPHQSEQDVATPWELIRAVEARFGAIKFDLAATEENAKAPAFWTAEDDSLQQDWTKLTGNLWLNPPYGDIPPWAQKCKESRAPRFERRIFLLTPASVSTEWFNDNVHGHARVLAIRPRIKFVGHDSPYPKDLILSCYGEPPGFDTWRWDENQISYGQTSG
jgi:phage N-6-adenine-methyltransferase